MIKELIAKQSKLRPLLLGHDYSFIGPVDDGATLEAFMRAANQIDPGDLFNNSIHKMLSNDQITLQAIKIFPSSVPLRIYVVTRTKNDTGILVHSTVKEYCSRNKIEFAES